MHGGTPPRVVGFIMSMFKTYSDPLSMRGVLTLCPDCQMEQADNPLYRCAFANPREDVRPERTCYHCGKRDAVTDKIVRLSREEIVGILENEAGIACYDEEPKEVLVEALRVNIGDDTLPESCLE